MDTPSQLPVVLVTGATGFIGGHLIESLRKDAWQVVAFVRQSSNRQTIPEGVEIREGNLLDPESLESVLEGVSVVVHLAAQMDFYPSNLSAMFRVNVEGTENLLRAFADAPGDQKRRFIYVSSTEAIGASPSSGEPATEDSKLRPVYHYGQTKVTAEARVRAVSVKQGIDYMILRPTGVLGPGDFFTIYELMQMVNSGLLCFIPGAGDAKLMYTHVADVVQAISLSLISQPAGQTCIICPDQALTYERWIRVLSEELGRFQPFIHLPVNLVKLVTRCIAPLMNLGKSRTFMYQVKTIDRMGEHRNYSNDLAKDVLGYLPQHSLEDTIRETVQWNLKEGHLWRWPLSPFILSLLLLLAVLIVVWLLLLLLF